MNKKILVTGAAGFIGSFLCEELVSHNYFVIGIDNFFRGKKENLCALENNPLFLLFEMDLCEVGNIGKINKLLNDYKIDTVMHFAAINGTQYFYDRPLFVMDQNIRMTQNLLLAIENTGVKSIIYASSSEVYGDPEKFPTDEQSPILLYESYDRDSYAVSKASSEFYVRLFAKQHNIASLTLRIFNTYGERMVGTCYGQVIPEFINRMLFEEKFTILGDGKHTRSFCYVKDSVCMIRALMEKQIAGLVNLGCDDEMSVLALAKKIHDIAQQSFYPEFLPERPNDHQRRKPDISHLKRLLGPLSFTPLAIGLKRMIDFYSV